MEFTALLIIICSILFALLVFLIYRSNSSLDKTEYIISDEKIPKDFDGFLIAQLSDFHNTRSEAVREQIISALLQSKPDIIVLTGDYFDYYRTDAEISLVYLKRLLLIAPVYYIPGNHEARISEYQKLSENAEKLGAEVLNDRLVTIAKGNSKINVIGVRDAYFYTDYVSSEQIKPFTDMLNSLSAKSQNYSVLLSHRPELLDVYADAGVNLVLSGHAHGGQFRLPYIGGLFSPSQGVFPKYTNGVFAKDGTKMAVSRGIGNSSFPFRFNNNPELVYIILSNK
ncbi:MULTISPECIES: metallophosphoesterase [unclassified Ruminococcus]|uniref:metallophosphoesterase n=1 Tax=unclassified Ruminococcus TaxID=2608920 RepID=UPI00210EDC2D|nr:MULTISPECIES: metallophosphoesterase [unclassified Ruminococcus]MCQ4022672.1 metallophosphoesterase [Ruminococcus sp. zg-924]MCQ4114912.1 metallophosphoesterase [Ruminococcus sp. zg-921]